MDYRKADPKYTGFIPKTAAEAIDLFVRFRNLGVPVTQWPETFVSVSQALEPSELDLFREWLVCPQGEPRKDGQMYEPCAEIEAERRELARQADARDDEKLDRRARARDDEKLDFGLGLGDAPLERSNDGAELG